MIDTAAIRGRTTDPAVLDLADECDALTIRLATAEAILETYDEFNLQLERVRKRLRSVLRGAR